MGTNNTVMSSIIMKGESEAALTKALQDANKEAIKLDPKDTKRQK